MFRKIRNKKEGRSIWIEIAGWLLIVLACIALISIIVNVLAPLFCPEKFNSLKEASVNGMMLTCVTLSITLAVVVPWMISRTRIYDVAEDAVKKYYDKDFKREIRRNQEALLRASANEARMIAYLLCEAKKPIWALGWICKSATTYDKIERNYQYNTYTKLKVSNVHVLIDCIRQIATKMADNVSMEQILRDDNEEKEYEVAIRTTKDLIKFCSTFKLRDRDYAGEFADNAGMDVPETLEEALHDLLNYLVAILKEKKPEELKDKLELYNEEGEDVEKYKDFYLFTEKQIQNQQTKYLEEKFKDTAKELAEKYNEYLKSQGKPKKPVPSEKQDQATTTETECPDEEKTAEE